MGKLKLTVNEEKTRICRVPDGEFDYAAKLTAGRGNIALTQLRYIDAADRFKEAAAYVPTGHGDEKGDNAALKQSIEIWHLVLAERTRERVPLDWASTQTNLGNALRTLGEREDGTAHLEEAVAAHRAALEEITRDRVPLGWAETQINLGAALMALSQ